MARKRDGTASGREIQEALGAFVARWRDYEGTERAEAQTFLNELFACYGSDRSAAGAHFEDFKSSAGFMDLHWPGTCIVEMKAPQVPLGAKPREQVKRYWEESADEGAGIPAARWVVLCNFKTFEVWEPGRFPKSPRTTFTLEQLPDRYEALLFLTEGRQQPAFLDGSKELTAAAAGTVAQVYQSLQDRSAAPPDVIQRFVMQTVWTLFAEDLHILDGMPFQRTVQRLRQDPTRSPAAEIGWLFTVLNQKGDHNRKDLLAGTHYVNGELFADPASVDLNPAELDLLADAAAHDWSKVEPTIFGSLMEGLLGHDRRWELGAHYTHEADIMKIVGPTIVEPWQQRIDACASPAEARALLDELCAFTVLDPACGCGNFLYVAYRELRALEYQLKERITELAETQGLPLPAKPWPYFSLMNLRGLDIERMVVFIARVVLWMGHRQMIDRYGEAEPVLPLVSLDGIRAADALRVPWPEADAIIGNPPFLGASHVRGALGSEYVEWLKREFGVGVKDLCTYWFRLAQQHLKPGHRAGLVGTNSISQNLGRAASLEYIVAQGGAITNAVSSQKWPGDAKVHVSLVNWINGEYDGPHVLDGEVVEGIDASLRVPGDWTPQVLTANKNHCFEGPSPKAKGLLIGEGTARRLLARTDTDYSVVVRPYLTADDITKHPEQKPSRWAIDFGLRSLEQALQFPAAIEIVRQLVKPERESNNRKSYREKWWLFAEPRTALRHALQPLGRFAASARHGKRLVVSWQRSRTLASDATDVFAFDDDFSMGVLQSRAHIAWAWHQASTLKGDLRYTPTSVFMTFPWPDGATDEQRHAVAAACVQLLTRRTEICTGERIGLTTLYNRMDDGAYTDLKALHKTLDEAVAACYGWPKKIAQDDVALVAHLSDLNRAIATGGRPYRPFKA